MRVVTWNTNFRSAECLAGIDHVRPDVVFLQEVKHASASALTDALRRLGCSHAHYSGSGRDREKRYGNVTASRWPISPAIGWSPGMPWPQLALRAVVHAPDGDLDTINVHIPNGSGNGWRKVEAFEALSRALESAPEVPRILAGDFNEPQTVLSDGTVVSFGQRIRADGTVCLGRRGSKGRRFKDKEGREDDLERWVSAVCRVFAASSPHGLCHVHGIHDGKPLPATHVVRGRPRFFDHLFVSRHLSVTSYAYEDSVRENLRYSDHSALHAEVEIACA